MFDNVKRFLVLILEEDESIMVKNNIIYNIPFEVSEKNNNIPPNPYDKDNVLLVMKQYLQKMFIKPNPENYVYYSQELRGCDNVSINFLTEDRGMTDSTTTNISLEDAKAEAFNDVSIWALEYNLDQQTAIFRTLKSDGSKPLHNFTSRYTNDEIIDERNNYQYSCSTGSSFQIYSHYTLSENQKILINEQYPGKEPPYYACVQGCPGTCNQIDKKSFLAGSWDTYLKKDIIFEHPDYQRYKLSAEKSTTPIGNTLDISSDNCVNTKTLQDAVNLCNDTIGCESFFRYLPGSAGANNPSSCALAYCNHHPDLKNAFCGGSTCSTEAQADSCRKHWDEYGKVEGREKSPEKCMESNGSMRTCFKGYAYQEDDLNKISELSSYKGDVYVKKKKDNYTFLDEKSDDVENLRYGDFITINNKYPTNCGDDCTKEYQAYIDILEVIKE